MKSAGGIVTITLSCDTTSDLYTATLLRISFYISFSYIDLV